MNPLSLTEQSRRFAAMMPALMRQLAAGSKSPADELPLAQLRVCAILLAGPRSMSSLSQELGVSLSAMTQIADRLERVALVHRYTADDDRRVRVLQLTDHGREIMEAHEAARLIRATTVLKHLTSQQREEALESLQLLLEASLAAREQNDFPQRPRSSGSRSKVNA
jgi:DNA-binding MarR family transcriptional regulator